MRLHKFLAFFLLASLPAFAQNSQSQNSKAPAAQTSPEQQPSEPPAGFVRDPFVQQSVESPSTQPQARSLGEFKIKKIQVLPPNRRLLRKPQQLPDAPLDPGIYIKSTSGAGTLCGAIVSYNFSQDENPRLESITTCTPSGRVTTRRTGGEDEKVIVPRLVQTK